MDVSRLKNILQSIDVRVARILKYISDSPAFAEISDILTAFQVTVAHYIADPSQLDAESVTDLRQLVAQVEKQLSNFVLAIVRGAPTPDPVATRLALDCTVLSNQVAGLAIGLAINEPEKLAALVPEQKVAPFQFAVVGDRLIVREQKSELSERTAAIAEQARNALVEQSDRIREDLSKSNASPRLRQAFDAVHRKLSDGTSIVALGMFNRTCGRMVSADISELPDTMIALLVSQVEGVNSLIAQHPDWREFAQASMAADIDPQSVADLISTARLLAERLRDDRLAASEGVTRALDQVADWAEEAGAEEKREALSLGRTLGNLLSVVVRAMASFGKEIRQEAKKGAAKVILGVLLSVATLSFGVAVSRVPGGEWVEGAITYLRELAVPPAGG